MIRAVGASVVTILGLLSSVLEMLQSHKGEMSVVIFNQPLSSTTEFKVIT